MQVLFITMASFWRQKVVLTERTILHRNKKMANYQPSVLLVGHVLDGSVLRQNCIISVNCGFVYYQYRDDGSRSFSLANVQYIKKSCTTVLDADQNTVIVMRENVSSGGTVNITPLQEFNCAEIVNAFFLSLRSDSQGNKRTGSPSDTSSVISEMLDVNLFGTNSNAIPHFDPIDGIQKSTNSKQTHTQQLEQSPQDVAGCSSLLPAPTKRSRSELPVTESQCFPSAKSYGQPKNLKHWFCHKDVNMVTCEGIALVCGDKILCSKCLASFTVRVAEKTTETLDIRLKGEKQLLSSFFTHKHSTSTTNCEGQPNFFKNKILCNKCKEVFIIKAVYNQT